MATRTNLLFELKLSHASLEVTGRGLRHAPPFHQNVRFRERFVCTDHLDGLSEQNTSIVAIKGDSSLPSEHKHKYNAEFSRPNAMHRRTSGASPRRIDGRLRLPWLASAAQEFAKGAKESEQQSEGSAKRQGLSEKLGSRAGRIKDRLLLRQDTSSERRWRH